MLHRCVLVLWKMLAFSRGNLHVQCRSVAFKYRCRVCSASYVQLALFGKNRSYLQLV